MRLYLVEVAFCSEPRLPDKLVVKLVGKRYARLVRQRLDAGQHSLVAYAHVNMDEWVRIKFWKAKATANAEAADKAKAKYKAKATVPTKGKA